MFLHRSAIPVVRIRSELGRPDSVEGTAGVQGRAAVLAVVDARWMPISIE